MREKNVVSELNEYLQGEFMAIHSYEHFIQKASDPRIKKELQKIQQDHKLHATKIAEQIQNLGGKAVEDNGLKLSIMEGVMKLKGIPSDEEEIIKQAIKGQEMGIKKTEEIVRGDLDEESLHIVQSNLDEDRGHIDLLTSLMN